MMLVLNFLILLWLAPTSFSQLALASSSYLNGSPRQSSGIGIRDTHFLTLFTEVSEESPPPVHRNLGIESEIAAIFKGVAYGTTSKAPQQSTTTTTTTTTTTSTTTTPPPTHPQVFIGKQKEVRINVDLVPGAFPDVTTQKASEQHVPTTFTYLVNAEIHQNLQEEIMEERQNERVLPVPSYYPSPEPVENVQVQVSSAIQNAAYSAIQRHIQDAWNVHVYATGVLFGLMALACIVSMSRMSMCSQMLPRGYFITLHLIVFMACFFRTVVFLHDPYGAYERLPLVLTSLLENSTLPCLTTVYAVLLLVLLRAARVHVFPVNVQSPLLIAVLCGAHIGASVVVDVTSGVLVDSATINTIYMIMQTVTAVWSALLCLMYVISFSGIAIAAAKQKEDISRLTIGRNSIDSGKLYKTPSRPSLTYASRFFLICTIFHVLLIAFLVVSMCTHKVPLSPSASDAWAWWTQKTLQRLIEIIFAALVLATVFVLTQASPSNNNNKSDSDVFSIFKHYKRTSVGSKTMDVYPVATEKCNILGNRSLISNSPNSSMNYSFSGWKKNNYKTDEKCVKIASNDQKIMYPDEKYSKSFLFHPNLSTTNSCTMYPAPKQQWDSPKEFQYFPQGQGYTTAPHTDKACHNHESATLPNNQLHKNHCYQQAYAANEIKHLDIVRTPTYRLENEYEVASYYNNPANTTGSTVYAKPYAYAYNNGLPVDVAVHSHAPKPNYLRPDGESKSELSGCSSHSEIHVDYLTDASSMDGLGSLSRSVTLPVYMQHSSTPMERPQTLVFNKSCVANTPVIGYGTPVSTSQCQSKLLAKLSADVAPNRFVDQSISACTNLNDRQAIGV